MYPTVNKEVKITFHWKPDLKVDTGQISYLYKGNKAYLPLWSCKRDGWIKHCSQSIYKRYSSKSNFKQIRPHIKDGADKQPPCIPSFNAQFFLWTEPLFYSILSTSNNISESILFLQVLPILVPLPSHSTTSTNIKPRSSKDNLDALNEGSMHTYS